MADECATVFVGADVLDIMSIAMYAEPLVIYRELVQNSSDSIERAIREQIIAPGDGSITITFEPLQRVVVIRDNGFGLCNDDFEQQMLSLGASSKRSTTYRGFRGIGRLAGLGNCRKLVFKSRSSDDHFVYQASWDALRVREAIVRPDILPLGDVIRNAVTVERAVASGEPDHFFEVRLEGVRRLSDDRLFDPNKIANYLSQVAPVPFSPSASFGQYVKSELSRRSPLLEVSVTVGKHNVFKPYEDVIEVRKGRFSRVRHVQFVEVPSTEDSTAAFGWIAHTDYIGALPQNYAGRGLRVRSGNLQVGEDSLLAHAFPEERFNAWSIGEFHVFDPRLRPNARRDAFEPSIAVDDLFNQLAPYGAAIAKQCRLESKRRQLSKKLESVNDLLNRLEKELHRNRSALASSVKKFVYEQAASELTELGPLAQLLASDESPVVKEATKRLKRLNSVRGTGAKRLNQRERGQLDAIRWLYASGQEHLVGAIVAGLTEMGTNRRLFKDS
ncbi:MAG TPA: ATP-binding protein [Candidatus Cybelea sp.]|jgi:molecular chaperone HtpG|nr:ATP-binding protein [Candidatus Cybelea sp.]